MLETDDLKPSFFETEYGWQKKLRRGGEITSAHLLPETSQTGNDQIPRPLAADPKSKKVAGGQGPAEEIFEKTFLFADLPDLRLPRGLEKVLELGEAIDRLGDLKENFDGEGSPPISEENRNAAKLLLTNLLSARGILCDEVFPTAKGGVEVEAETRYWEAAFLVNSPDRIEFLVKTGGRRESGSGTLAEISNLIWREIAGT